MKIYRLIYNNRDRTDLVLLCNQSQSHMELIISILSFKFRVKCFIFFTLANIQSIILSKQDVSGTHTTWRCLCMILCGLTDMGKLYVLMDHYPQIYYNWQNMENTISLYMNQFNYNNTIICIDFVIVLCQKIWHMFNRRRQFKMPQNENPSQRIKSFCVIAI